jgi:uncharacterized membrane protein YhhN
MDALSRAIGDRLGLGIAVPLVPILAYAFIYAVSPRSTKSKGYVPAVFVCAFLKAIPIVLLAEEVVRASRSPLATAVRRGLWLSAGGDVALEMEPAFPRAKLFEIGLILFLAGHVYYVVGLRSGAAVAGLDITKQFVATMPFFAIGATVFTVLQSNLGKLKVPVGAYCLVISAMGASAAVRWTASSGQPGSALGVAGASLFMASDSVIAFNKFRSPVPQAKMIIMSTYYAAQVLIASSAVLE